MMLHDSLLGTLRSVRRSERVVQLLAGGFFVWRGFARSGWPGLVLAAAGGALIKAGLVGKPGALSLLCDALEHWSGAPILVIPSPTTPQRFGEGTRDLVDEASWESFPASDPPGY